jgi:hypothetical protein
MLNSIGADPQDAFFGTGITCEPTNPPGALAGLADQASLAASTSTTRTHCWARFRPPSTVSVGFPARTVLRRTLADILRLAAAFAPSHWHKVILAESAPLVHLDISGALGFALAESTKVRGGTPTAI